MLKCVEPGGFGYCTFSVGIISTEYEIADLKWTSGSSGFTLEVGWGSCSGVDLYPRHQFKQGDIITIKYEAIIDDIDEHCHGELYFGLNDQDLKKGYDNISD